MKNIQCGGERSHDPRHFTHLLLYALVPGQVQREMHLSAAMSGAMMSVTLIAAAIERHRLRLVR